MSDQLLPDFDGPGSQPDAVRPGPKKPRRKPAKKVVKRGPPPAKRVPKKRRVRKINKNPALAAPYKADSTHAGGRYSRDVYTAIGSLMGMKGSDREAVLDIVKGLCSK